MFTQLAIGSLLTIATIVMAAAGWWGVERLLLRVHGWAIRPPHGPKLITILSLALIGALGVMTIAVWLWAAAFWLLEIFVTFEASVYFSLVSFTTLGFGDVLLPIEWRLLGGMAAANGLLMFGLLTAVLVEILRDTRQRQRDGMS